MKKKTIAAIVLALAAMCLFAQGGKESRGINVISREEGSGTRGAFVELVGVEEKVDGVKKDLTVSTAEIANSTSVVITSVSGNRDSIGYISLGSLSDKVKALAIDGVVPEVDTVKDGSYPIARPFNVAYMSLSETAEDFLSFILSSAGQAIVASNGYVQVGQSSKEYEPKGLSGKLTISGSSSVYPVMEKLMEKYSLLNQKVEVTLLQSDSTTGIKDALSGNSDLGMASRELKASETESGLSSTVIAMDGIAVIVNKDNPRSGLSKTKLKDIYQGKVLSWDEL